MTQPAGLSTTEITEKARKIRISIIKMLLAAGSGHVGGSLGVADILATLYFGQHFQHDPAKPHAAGRDRFILSNGHICPALYATLAEAGYFPKAELLTLRKLHSRLQGHPVHRYSGHHGQHDLPGLEATTGSLGQGIEVAAGMALGFKLSGRGSRVICMTGDGEHQEGSVWEVLMFAAHKKLDNLTVIVDRNTLQIDGSTEQVMHLEPLSEKYQAFGWQVIDVDGHNPAQIDAALGEAASTHLKPTVLIAHTTMGKGVPMFENDFHYHGVAPKPAEAAQALTILGVF